MTIDPPSAPNQTSPQGSTSAAHISNVDLTQKDRLPVILSFLDDSRRLIEAGKGRRWDVFKWTFAANIALVAASYVPDISNVPARKYLLFLGAIAVSMLGSLLIYHYNDRMQGARHRARGLVEWISENIAPISEITRQPEAAYGATLHDRFEVAAFALALYASSLLIPLVHGIR